MMSDYIKYSVSKKIAFSTTLLKGRYFFILYHLAFTIHHFAIAQVGTWQTHVSYQSGQSVAVIGSKVYAATQNGFFYYDKTTGETTTLSKTAGLNDVGINRLLYLPDQKELLIAYQSGNLDFLALTDTGEPQSVRNVSTVVASASLPAARGINHVNRIGNYAYLSTDFGLVVLDLAKNEIRDTYFSQRADGSPLPIYQTAVSADSLFALTAPLQTTGVGRQLRATRFAATINIADPANWKPIAAPGLQLESIVYNQGQLSATVNGSGVYGRQNGNWNLTQYFNNPIIRLFPSAGLLLATDKVVTFFGVGSFLGSLLANPREVVIDGANVWVADTKSGLLFGQANGQAGQFQRIAPEGPTRDQFATLFTYPQTLVALPNSFQDATANQPPYELFSVPNARWSGPENSSVTHGFNSTAYSATEQRLYLGGYGSGLWQQTEGQVLSPVTLPPTISPFITSLATDINGDLWITTGQANSQQATLHVRRVDGTFASFTTINQTNIAQIVPDDNGSLWLRPGLGGGLIVVDPQMNRSRYLTTLSGQGGLLTNNVRTLAKDRNGAIWVGTDLGPTVFDNPYGAFGATIDAQPPTINRRRLLANELITSIVVDGGNRKWLGTQNGLYHVSPDGSQLLNTFTAATSPLPTNSIQALAIEPVSGEVFIQTGKGLVSYRGSATEPAETLTNLTIFPNPVRPDFNGTVGINGLVENTTVKILDAGGQLVYETRSQGGTATWNLYDYRGRQAQTGIYLVVVVTANGSAGLAGKLAVVR